MIVLTNPEKAAAPEARVRLDEHVEQLFRDARCDVYYYIMSFGLAAHEAQEIVQDVFLRLYATLKRGVEIENSRAWVFRTAHNMAINAIEQSKNRRLLAPEAALSAVPRGESLEGRLIRKQRVERLKQALSTLSPRQRLCLHLRAQGLRYADIAKAIGVSPSTVGEFLSRAIRKLRSAVHE